MKYLIDVWYVAAWPEEVGRGLLARTIAERPVVLFRREDGTPAALEDRCPHRIVPLSRGRLVGDAVECGYHGLTFDCSGACIANPHGDHAIPRAARVRAYPVTERHGIVWIWMGQPELADPVAVPHVPYMKDSNAYKTTHVRISADYRYDLLIDNLMDLSHAEYLHKGSFSSGVFDKVTIEVKEDGDCVRMRRILHAVPIPPFFRAIYDPGDSLVDHWQDMIWHPSQIIEFEFGVVKTGHLWDEGAVQKANHIATPATARTTNYFASLTRETDLEDADLDELMRQGQLGPVQNEDSPMLEAQQALVGNLDISDYKPILLNVDAGAVRVRRVVDRLLKAEEARRVGSRALAS